jgi:hypothetical protein
MGKSASSNRKQCFPFEILTRALTGNPRFATRRWGRGGDLMNGWAACKPIELELKLREAIPELLR